jgi:rRNA-processing protein FCF1
MKFRTIENKEFSLYFDITTDKHKRAKTIFKDLKATRKRSTDVNIDFENEVLLKSFATEQIFEIYNPEKGDSFANAVIEKQTFYSIELYAGVIYDFQLNAFKMKIYNTQTKSAYFTENANAIEDLKANIIHYYFSSLSPVNSLKSEAQSLFEEKTCEIQSDVDYLLFQNKPQEAIEKINQYHSEVEIIENEHFWQNIDTILDSNITEVFFNIPEFCEVHNYAVQKIVKAQPNVKISLAFVSTLIEIDDTDEKLYLLENSTAAKFWCLTKKWLYIELPYHFSVDGKIYTINIIAKRQTDKKATDSWEKWKKRFAEKYIPILLEKFQNYLQNKLEVSLQNIESVQNSDSQLLCFENWFAELGFAEHYSILQESKKELLDNLKQQYKGLLSERIESLKNETDFDAMEKLEQINKIHSKIKAIENECIFEYIELKEDLDKIKNQLFEKESYIKDQLLAKHYIIDTNVFVDCPEILSKIDIKHNVVLSARVIDELDKLKYKLRGKEKENAENALKLINRKLGKKKNVKTAKADLRLLPLDFNDKSPDNLILCVALMYREKNPFMITSDNGLQAKARVCEIPTLSLAEFLYPDKFKNKGVVYNLPVNKLTGEMLDVKILVGAYKSEAKKNENVVFSKFQTALSKIDNGFSHKDYGFLKFKDFCNTLTEIFEIKTNEKGIECLILKSE